MNPHKRTVEHFLKLAGRKAAYLPLAVLSVALGAFVVGAIVNAASLTPPTAAYPEGQPQLDLGGGGGASNLLDALNGGSLAEWGVFKKDTVIGGRLGLGQTRKTTAGTLMLGYPLDMQIVHKSTEDPSAAELAANAYLNKNDAAVLRIASGSATANEKLYTGVRLDRIGLAASTTDNDTFSEKWFIGMDNATDNLVIRANSSENLVSIDPSKGAACFGGMYVGLTQSTYNGRVDEAAGGGGYAKANEKCGADQSGAHVCSEEEIIRTIICNPTKLPSSGSAWINRGTPGYTSLLSNDCNGWTETGDSYRGGTWLFNNKGGYGLLAACKGVPVVTKKKFACCK